MLYFRLDNNIRSEGLLVVFKDPRKYRTEQLFPSFLFSQLFVKCCHFIIMLSVSYPSNIEHLFLLSNLYICPIQRCVWTVCPCLFKYITYCVRVSDPDAISKSSDLLLSQGRVENI